MQPKKAVIENFRAHEEDYGIACTEFAKAYVHSFMRTQKRRLFHRHLQKVSC